jgi:lysozyme
MRLYEFYANPDATPSNPKYRNDISQQLGPLEIGQQSTRMKNSSKKFIQVLKQDKILSPATKQALANIQKKVEQENNNDTPLWGKVFMLATAVMFLTNKLSAAAQAFADKDGDGDIDLDDMNEWNPDQIEQGFDQLKQLTTLMKSPQWSEMTQEERNAFVKFGAELEGKLTNMMQIHQSSDDKQVDMDDYISAQDEMEYNELVNKLKKSEASKPFKGNEDKVKAAHDKYGADIDKVKLSDDPLAVYKMYDTEGNYRVYLDSEGKPTVGIGHLIDNDSPGSVKNLKVGDTITPAQAHELFKTDVDDAVKLTNAAIKAHPNLINVDYNASAEVSYQMGNKVWKGFPNTMKLIDAGDYLGASEEVMKSKWAKQTPQRAKAFSDALVMAHKMSP